MEYKSLIEIELKDLDRYLILILCILAFFMPGYMFLFITDSTFIKSASDTVIILTSILYTLPIFIVWLIVVYFIEKNDLKRKPSFLIPGASIYTLGYSFLFPLFYISPFFNKLCGMQNGKLILFYLVHFLLIAIHLFSYFWRETKISNK